MKVNKILAHLSNSSCCIFEDTWYYYVFCLSDNDDLLQISIFIILYSSECIFLFLFLDFFHPFSSRFFCIFFSYSSMHWLVCYRFNNVNQITDINPMHVCLHFYSYFFHQIICWKTYFLSLSFWFLWLLLLCLCRGFWCLCNNWATVVPICHRPFDQ